MAAHHWKMITQLFMLWTYCIFKGAAVKAIKKQMTCPTLLLLSLIRQCPDLCVLMSLACSTFPPLLRLHQYSGLPLLPFTRNTRQKQHEGGAFTALTQSARTSRSSPLSSGSDLIPPPPCVCGFPHLFLQCPGLDFASKASSLLQL